MGDSLRNQLLVGIGVVSYSDPKPYLSGAAMGVFLETGEERSKIP